MKTAPMKPETIARRARERAIDAAARKQSLLERTRANALRDGPGSFWADYYADMVQE